MSDVSLGFVCNPYHRGGITRWMIDLAVEWGRTHGHAWFVTARPRRPFVSAGGRPTMSDLLGEVADARITLKAPVVGVTFEFGMEAHRAAVYARAIETSLPEGTPLVVSDDPAAWRAAAAVAGRYPLLGVLHSDEQHYYRLAQRFGNEAAALVSVSARIDARARVAMSQSEAVRVVIPCGTPLGAHKHNGGLAQEFFRLLWVGRFDERQKRVSDLPAIVAHAERLGVACRLSVAGAGEDEAILRDAILRLNMGERVELLGWRSATELHQLRCESDILLLPSNFEGMPLAVMEALAAGCGVVASRVSGIEDYIDHPDAEWCYWTHDVGDVQAAAELVIKAARVPANERIRHARAMAHDLFSIEKCAERYREVVERLPEFRNRRLELPKAMSGLLSMPLAASRFSRLWCASRLAGTKRRSMPARSPAERHP